MNWWRDSDREQRKSGYKHRFIIAINTDGGSMLKRTDKAANTSATIPPYSYWKHHFCSAITSLKFLK
jgi:hypothetical protein